MSAFKAVNEYAGVVQWLESQPSKLVVWVRFPSPAPLLLIYQKHIFNKYVNVMTMRH